MNFSLIMQQNQIQKNGTDIDTSKIGKKIDLASLQSEIDKLDIKKLKITPVDLSKVSNVVKMKLLILYTVCDELIKKVNAIQTTDTSH